MFDLASILECHSPSIFSNFYPTTKFSNAFVYFITRIFIFLVNHKWLGPIIHQNWEGNLVDNSKRTRAHPCLQPHQNVVPVTQCSLGIATLVVHMSKDHSYTRSQCSHHYPSVIWSILLLRWLTSFVCSFVWRKDGSTVELSYCWSSGVIPWRYKKTFTHVRGVSDHIYCFMQAFP